MQSARVAPIFYRPQTDATAVVAVDEVAGRTHRRTDVIITRDCPILLSAGLSL